MASWISHTLGVGAAAQLGQRAPCSRFANPGRRPASKALRRAAVCFLENDECSKQQSNGAGTVAVSFSLARRVAFGQELLLVGDAPALGGWDVGHAARLRWHEGDVWRCTIELPVGASLEYKFVTAIPNSPPEWESCGNRTLSIEPSITAYCCAWNAPLDTTWPGLNDASGSGAGADTGADESGRDSPVGEVTDDDQPPPPFKPAQTFNSIADAVKKIREAVPGAPAVAAAADKASSQQGRPEPASPAAAAAAATAAAASAVLSPAAGVVTGPAPAAEVTGEPAPAKPESKPGATPAATKPMAVGQPPVAAEAVPAPAPTKRKGSSLKSIGKAAGTVAMGVAATAVLSALAIDVTDAALLGAMTVGGLAAMSTPSAAGKGAQARRSKAGGQAATAAAAGSKAAAAGPATEGPAAEDKEAAGEEQTGSREVIGRKASAPGIILAASVLSVLDAGKKALASFDEANEEEEEEQ